MEPGGESPEAIPLKTREGEEKKRGGPKEKEEEEEEEEEEEKGEI